MSTLSELQEELAEVNAAIKRIRNAGQSASDASGRSQEQAKYYRLLEDKERLERRIQIVKNNGRVPGSGVIFGGN